jgi:hypothetical protein
MRFLVKVEMPTVQENPVIAEKDFDKQMEALLVKIGAEKAYYRAIAGKRVDYIIINIGDIRRIPEIGDAIYQWLKVKPEFLPEMAPDEVAKSKPNILGATKLPDKKL